MAVFLGILVFVSIIACIASLMIIIIKAIMHKSVKKIKFIPIISIGVFIVSMFLSLTCFPQDESYIVLNKKEVKEENMTPKEAASTAPTETVPPEETSEPTPTPAETLTPVPAETPTPTPSPETTTVDTTPIQNPNATESSEISNTVDIKNEDQFKKSCVEVVYNDLDKTWIGENVTKEILFTSSNKEEYECAATESYIEYYPSYQHVYAIYNIFDCRFNKEYSIQSDDVVRIYGVITDIKTNYGNGLDYPVIDMYYADYIRQWNYQ